jgi:hypothetical protein
MAEIARMRENMSRMTGMMDLTRLEAKNTVSKLQDASPSQDDDESPPGYISYEEAAHRLGMRMGSFRNIARRFTPLKIGRRSWLRSDDIDAELAKRGDAALKRRKTFDRRADRSSVGGEVASEAVTIFKSGGSVLDAVEKLHIGFEVAETAWNSYQKFAVGGSVAFSVDQSAAKVLAGMLDWKPPYNGQTLITAVSNYLQAHPAVPLTETEKAAVQAQQKESP